MGLYCCVYEGNDRDCLFVPVQRVAVSEWPYDEDEATDSSLRLKYDMELDASPGGYITNIIE